MIGGAAGDQFKIFGLVLFIFLLVDLPMILVINKKMYAEQFAKIGPYPKSYGVFLYALLCYMLMALSLQYFAINQNSLINALVLGLVIFGIYNTTNLCTLDKYEIKTAAVDIVWGTILYGIVYLIATLLIHMVPKSDNVVANAAAVTETTTEI